METWLWESLQVYAILFIFFARTSQIISDLVNCECNTDHNILIEMTLALIVPLFV